MMDHSSSQSLREIGATINGLSKKIAKIADQLIPSLTSADIASTEKFISELDETLTAFSSTTADALTEIHSHATSLGGLVGLQNASYELAREIFSDRQVFTSERSLVVYPAVVKFDQVKDDIRVTIDGNTISTTSADYVIEIVSASLRTNFDASKFLRSLYYAYKSICALTGRTSVPLEDIRQILSVTRDAVNTYSRDAFEADLQRWNSFDTKSISGKTAHLEHVAAARDGFPIISSSGARTVLSNISFS